MRRGNETVSVLDYVNAEIGHMEQRSVLRVDALARSQSERFSAIQTASDKAERAMNIRLEQMNEIRSQLGTQRAEFATNEKFDAYVTSARTQYETLVAQIASTADLLRTAAQRESDALRDRLDATDKAGVDARLVLERQIALCLPSERAETIAADQRARAEVVQASHDRELKLVNDAINVLQTQYATLLGRITGMGIIVIIVTLGLQLLLHLWKVTP